MPGSALASGENGVISKTRGREGVGKETEPHLGGTPFVKRRHELCCVRFGVDDVYGWWVRGLPPVPCGMRKTPEFRVEVPGRRWSTSGRSTSGLGGGRGD